MPGEKSDGPQQPSTRGPSHPLLVTLPTQGSAPTGGVVHHRSTFVRRRPVGARLGLCRSLPNDGQDGADVSLRDCGTAATSFAAPCMMVAVRAMTRPVRSQEGREEC